MSHVSALTVATNSPALAGCLSTEAMCTPSDFCEAPRQASNMANTRLVERVYVTSSFLSQKDNMDSIIITRNSAYSDEVCVPFFYLEAHSLWLRFPRFASSYPEQGFAKLVF